MQLASIVEEREIEDEEDQNFDFLKKGLYYVRAVQHVSSIGKNGRHTNQPTEGSSHGETVRLR